MSDKTTRRRNGLFGSMAWKYSPLWKGRYSGKGVTLPPHNLVDWEVEIAARKGAGLYPSRPVFSSSVPLTRCHLQQKV